FSPIVSLLCCSKCYQRSGIKPRQVQDAKLAQFADVTAGLLERADKKRLELDSLRDTLEDEIEQKRVALDETNAQKLVEIADKRTALEKLLQELDDREHKHVRRELRETITNEIKSSLETPSSSARSRTYAMQVTALCLAGAGIFAYLTYSAQASINSVPDGLPIYLQYVKIFLSSAATVGFFAYAISWVRKLAVEEATHHRNLEQYAFDMNRASWVIETILELTDAELEELPNTWLESVCSSLFERPNTAAHDTNSLDALAALLNVTTEAEIGPNGPTFKLNRRAAKRAAASGE
ncbi:hypothetical protein, partial [Yoonia maritima]|uniref:hypothetical protein n=1 Tax=Yoonia maritima TaxID=1435347 RepID=UPI0019550826